MAVVDGDIFKAEVVAHNPTVSKAGNLMLVVDLKLLAKRNDPLRDQNGYVPVATEDPVNQRIFIVFKDDQKSIEKAAKNLAALGYKGSNPLSDLDPDNAQGQNLVGSQVFVKAWVQEDDTSFWLHKDLVFKGDKPSADQIKTWKRASGAALEEALTKF